VTITNNGPGSSITGMTDDGIFLSVVTGNVLISNASGGAIWGRENGIDIHNVNGGNVTVNNTSGTITGVTKDGIYVFDVDAGNVTVNNMNGSIVGGDTGVLVSSVTQTSSGNGHVSITNVSGNITGSGDEGVAVINVGGNVSISNNNGSISGYWDGIDASSIGGNFSVTNVSGGSIRGTHTNGTTITGGGDGIDFDNVGGNVVINNNGGTIVGYGDGIDGDNNHVGGSVTIHNVASSITGMTDDGIFLTKINGDILINNTSGTVQGNESGIQIAQANGDVTVNNTSGSIDGATKDGVRVSDVDGGNVVINNNLGSITGDNNGIFVTDVTQTTKGNGNVSIFNSSSGFISGSTQDGIFVSNVSGGGDVYINNTNNGSIFGGDDGIDIRSITGSDVDILNGGGMIVGSDDGIFASNVDGHFNVSNTSGNITGLNGDGIDFSSIGDNSGSDPVTINNTNGTIKGANNGIIGVDAESSVSITNVGGSITGTTGYWTLTSLSLTSVYVISAGGDGIRLDNIDGTITVNNSTGSILGYEDGIDIDDVWTGSVVISNTSGYITGLTKTGVAVTEVDGGGSVMVFNNSGSIFGADHGVRISDIDDGGSVTVTNVSGLIVGSGSEGVHVSQVQNGGNVLINNNSGQIWGATDGIEVYGVSATSLGAGGDVTISNTSGFITGNSTDGIFISQVTGGGSVVINNNLGSIIGFEDGIDIETVAGGGDVTITNVSGLISGSTDDGIEVSGITGSDVFINNNNGSIFGMDDGINLATVSGMVTISNTGGSIVGSTDEGIDMSNIGGPVTINNGALGVIMGSEEAIELNSGATMTINNSGLIQGALADFTDPVIYSEAPNGLTINNGSLGVIQGLGAPVGGVAIVEESGALTLNNGGLVVGQVYALGGTKNDVVNNSGTWSVTGTNSFSSQTKSGADVVNNSGAVNTAFNSGSLETTSFLDLETWNNAGGIIDMRDGAHGDTTSMPGTVFNGGAGSFLGLDTFLGAPGSISDVLEIGSSPSGTTNIIVVDSNGGNGAYNPTGILLVDGSSVSGAFVLDPSSSHYMGGILQKGLWDYELVFNGSQHLLVGEPGQVAHQIPVIASAAQAMFIESTGLWRDRTADLRYYANQGQGTGKPGAWVEGYGNWGYRDGSSTLSSPLTSNTYNTSYDSNGWGVMSGLDTAKEDLGNGGATLIVGILAGYNQSKVTFDEIGTTFEIKGASVGGYLTYIRNQFFTDVVVKYDLLDLYFTAPNISGYSGSRDVDVRTFGAVLDLGYRHEFNNSDAYIEPLLSVVYANTKVDDFSILGTTVDFENNNSFRGSLGLRVGGIVSQTSDYIVDISVDGRIWNEFEGDNKVWFHSAGPDLMLLDDVGAMDAYGEVSGMINYVDLSSGWSFFVKGGVKFDSNYQSNIIRAGARIQF